MRIYKLAVVGGMGCMVLAGRLPAQVTNVFMLPPATALEAAEGTIGKMTVKATAPVGSVPVGKAEISVTCEEVDVTGGAKALGIRVGIGASEQAEDRTLIDYDELDSLLGAISNVIKIDWQVTSMSSFEATFATKAGLRVTAFSSHRAAMVEYSVRAGQMSRGLVVSQVQLTQLSDLLTQAKTNLDGLRGR